MRVYKRELSKGLPKNRNSGRNLANKPISCCLLDPPNRSANNMTSLRTSGKRRGGGGNGNGGGNVKAAAAYKDPIGKSLGLSHVREPGETVLNAAQIDAIETLFNSNPTIAAARTILRGQLLSGGLEVRRNGKLVQLKPAFKLHLDDVWTSFAASVLDSFLKFGFVVVGFEEDEESVAARKKRKRKKGVNNEEAAKKTEEAEKAGAAGAAGAESGSPVIPVVPTIDMYDLSFLPHGATGFKRKYLVRPRRPDTTFTTDEDADVHVREPPDAQGNVCSPMASVFDLGSFTAALTDLALSAEVSNTRPRIFTQPVKESHNKNGLTDPTSLFFDSESRAVQGSNDRQDSSQQVQLLAIQQELCAQLNRLQQFERPDLSKRVGKQIESTIPPEIPAAIFTAPKGQEMVSSNGSMAQARGDLESLTRLTIEQVGAAFGVPTDLIFQGRFSGKSTAQLNLLNSTVAQLAKSIDKVLTRSYVRVYGEDEADITSLNLSYQPMQSTEEIAMLFSAGLLPTEVAVRSAMNAIGASTDAIESAVQEMKKQKQEEEKQLQQQQQQQQKQQQKQQQEQQQEQKQQQQQQQQAKKAEAGDKKPKDAKDDN